MVAIAVRLLEVQLQRRACARLQERRLQVNAALCGLRLSRISGSSSTAYLFPRPKLASSLDSPFPILPLS